MNKEEIVSKVEIGNSLIPCQDKSNKSKAKGPNPTDRITVLDCRKADYWLKDLLARFPWETALKKQGAQDNKQISQDRLLKALERSTLTCRNSQGNGRKPG